MFSLHRTVQLLARVLARLAVVAALGLAAVFLAALSSGVGGDAASIVPVSFLFSLGAAVLASLLFALARVLSDDRESAATETYATVPSPVGAAGVTPVAPGPRGTAGLPVRYLALYVLCFSPTAWWGLPAVLVAAVVLVAGGAAPLPDRGRPSPAPWLPWDSTTCWSSPRSRCG